MNEESEQHDERASEQPEHDPLLNAMLSWHLQDRLGSQVGGARERFDRYIDADKRSPLRAAPVKRAPAGGMSFWSKTVLGGAIAAAITIVSLRHVLLPIDQRTTRDPHTTIVGPEITPVSKETPLLQDSSWQTIDQGIVELEDGSPARRLLQRRLDKVKYFDKKRNATVEYTVPREETVYVGLNKY